MGVCCDLKTSHFANIYVFGNGLINVYSYYRYSFTLFLEGGDASLERQCVSPGARIAALRKRTGPAHRWRGLQEADQRRRFAWL